MDKRTRVRCRQDETLKPDEEPTADYILRASISFLISAMALAGFRPFGQVRVQFMMV